MGGMLMMIGSSVRDDRQPLNLPVQHAENAQPDLV
jgi:hypothetical protein